MIEIPGSVSLREQLGIEQEDPKIFRPISLEEAVEVAKLTASDASLDPDERMRVEIGIILDLMPAHLTPAKQSVATALRLSTRTIRRRELEWELIDPIRRFDLVRSALRLLIANRAARL